MGHLRFLMRPLIIFFIIGAILMAYQVWSGCCEDYCTDAEDCLTAYHDKTCDEVDACRLGCCIDSTLQNHTMYPKILCERGGGFLDVSCESPGLCVFESCLDGTPNNRCSVNSPMICKEGLLMADCKTCGCPEGYECQPDDGCKRNSTNYQIVAVPVNWPSDDTRDLYRLFVEDASNFFRESTRFASCPDDLEVVVMEKSCDVGALCVNAGTAGVTSADGVLTKIKNCVEDAGYFDYDVFVGVADVCANCPTDTGTCVDGWSLKLGDCQGTLNGVLTGITDISTFSHELGHVYGTCDEYDGGVWYYQDLVCRESSLFCPNQFIENPSGCSISSGDLCYGKEVSEGHYSVMGSGPVNNDRYTLESVEMINSKLPLCS